MKKENQKYLLLLLLLGGGYVAYKIYSKKPKEDDKKDDSGNKLPSPTPTPTPTKGFDPIALAKSDPEFKEYVMHMQQLLNIVLPQLGKPQIVADGFIGVNTNKAIRDVFGDRYLPIQSKEGVKFLISELEKKKTNVQNTPTNLNTPTQVAARITQAKKVQLALTKLKPEKRWFTWVDNNVNQPFYNKDLLGDYRKEGELAIQRGAKIQVTSWKILDTGFILTLSKLPSGKLRYMYISPWSVSVYY